jgi:hypothetical protein
MSDINKGFIQHGGTIKADVFAGGENARASKTDGQERSKTELEDIYLKLEELENAIKEHAEKINQSEDVIDATKAVRSQLQSDKPNKLTVLSILNGITQSVQSIAGIATMAESIKAAVTGLF